MSMRKAVWLAAAGCLGLALTVRGAGGKVKNSAEKVASPAVERLIGRLGDRNYRVRNAAQRRLAGMGVEILPLLLKARKGRGDLEVIRRLDDLIPNLERVALLQPKLVTLHLEKKPLQDVVNEIARQTGYGIDIQNNFNNQAYTFHFDRLPFWEALDRVAREAHLSVYPHYYGNGGDRIQLNTWGNPPAPHIAYTQTFRLVPNNMQYYRNVNYNGSFTDKADHPQRTETLTLTFTVHTEPKLPFLTVGQAVVTQAHDEMKRSMAPATTNTTFYSGPVYINYGNGRTFAQSVNLALVRPHRDSKFAKVIRGELPVTLLSKQMPEIVIDNPAAVKNKKFRSSKTEIDIEQVTVNNWNNGKMYQFQMTVKEQAEMVNGNWDYSWGNSLQHRLELYDAKGTKYLVWSSSLWNRGPRLAGGMIQFRPPDNGQVGPPVKLVFNRWVSLPHKIKFEFKDLPMP
jgi:hypothetical protein